MAATWQVLRGDCIETMSMMAPASIDAIVTDPPYGLGFMGKGWDALPPGREWAEECLRVLKPGGHLLAFGGTRTYHRLAVAIEDAGFEIRDTIAWMYGQGFPKSHNLKGAHEGWGTALKPAYEPVVVARKPLVGTVAANVLEYGTGALNIDACRVETGRWPANVALDEEAAALLDEQTGTLTSGKSNGFSGAYTKASCYGAYARNEIRPGAIYGDSGGASRFFYVAKASTKERNAGLDGRNVHPTVKPIEVMRWLVRMVTPPGGVVLDPFVGSGTTGCAAVLEGFRFIGIEREPEYADIAEARIRHWAQEGAPEPPAPAEKEEPDSEDQEQDTLF